MLDMDYKHLHTAPHRPNNKPQTPEGLILPPHPPEIYLLPVLMLF